MWLALTKHYGTKIRLFFGSDGITYYSSARSGSSLYNSKGNETLVRETPDQIDRMLGIAVEDSAWE